MKRTHVYIDGFNLYYRAVRGTPYKWLNLRRMCELLLTDNRIASIKYFTAHVEPRAGDPQAPIRQQTYLRALRTIDVRIILGQFRTNEVNRRTAGSSWDEPEWVRVVKTEEKGSDVNIATHMLRDGYEGQYECAVLVSNDSDLVEPLKVVKERIGRVVGVLNPQPKKASRSLHKFSHFTKTIRDGVLKESQFPEVLEDEDGEFRKPDPW